MSPTVDHVPSIHSHHKGSNVFIWSIEGKVIFSWCIDEHQKMAHNTLYRWLDIALEQDPHTGKIDYKVFPVKISRGSNLPLEYAVNHIKINGQIIPLDRDDDYLAPGDYALCYPDGLRSPIRSRFRSSGDFYTVERLLKLSRKTAHYLVDPPKSEVMTRGKFVCAFTGITFSENDLDVTWILPPHQADMMLKDFDSRMKLKTLMISSVEKMSEVMAPLCVLGNCLQLNSGVCEMFAQNLISVDVDDNYRIVRFVSQDVLEKRIKHPLLTHLRRGDQQDHQHQPEDKYLRAHLEWTLCNQAIGGGLSDDFDSDFVSIFLDQLNLHPKDEPESINFKGNAWESLVGQFVKAWYLKKPLPSWETFPQSLLESDTAFLPDYSADD